MPKYASAIMDGRKTVEFRKGSIPETVKIVVVYASSPVQEVLGYFQVKQIEMACPSVLWERYGRFGAISRAAFRVYFRGVETGKALAISCAYRIQSPVRLSVLGVRPPQSFCYLPSQSWLRLNRMKAHAVHGLKG